MEGLRHYELIFGADINHGPFTISSPPQVYLNPCLDRIYFLIGTGDFAAEEAYKFVVKSRIRRFVMFASCDCTIQLKLREGDDYIYLVSVIESLAQWYHNDLEEFGFYQSHIKPEFGHKLKLVEKENEILKDWKAKLGNILDALGKEMMDADTALKGVAGQKGRIYRQPAVRVMTLMENK